MLSRAGVLTLATLALAGCSQGPSEIRATGSSTVFPFTKAVADAFVRGGEGRKAPVIASTGTGAGFQSFCQAGDAEAVDLVDASRRMTRGEFDKCRANEMGDIIEVPIGLDGVALAESAQGPKLALTRRDVFLALAAEPTGAANAAKTWRDVNPRLPAVAI